MMWIKMMIFFFLARVEFCNCCSSSHYNKVDNMIILLKEPRTFMFLPYKASTRVYGFYLRMCRYKISQLQN